MTDTESAGRTREAGTDFPHPVMVEIKGLTRTATFTRLADAVAAVRTTLATLSLDDAHAAYLAEQFAPEAVDRIGRQLAKVGMVRSIAFVGINAHPIYIRPAAKR
ncbi:hypothetical protein [Kitasatospora sp. NPDC001175]|uniref:hypothetical protein n=1 Tax=Kitasatospora sp. NPDC001175 TaxID=3157103 RepID=UPI003CFC32E0